MAEVSLLLRIVIIILFAASASLSLYTARVYDRAYHLKSIAFWCIHVMVFTVVAALSVKKWLLIDPLWLNLWSNTVRLHGGIVAFSLAWHYASKIK